MQNILESQVSDLTHLADSPVSLHGSFDMNGHQRQTSSAESPARESGKRKSEDAHNGATHTRAKRNRYISIACNECKRRKIKCNGNTPCQRCSNLKLECQYAPNCCANGFKDSEEFRQMNTAIAHLQAQVNNLYNELNALRRGDSAALGEPRIGERSLSMSQYSVDATSPTARHPSGPKPPRFQGPTSSAYNLAVAKNTLYHMGYPGIAEGGDNGVSTQDDTPAGSPPPRQASIAIKSGRDPLWHIGADEAIRLCRVYEEEMGIMYPVLNIENLIQYATNLFQTIDNALRTGMTSESSLVGQSLKDNNANILKMVLAVAMIVEGGGENEVGARLYESVKEHADAILHQEGVELKSLPLLVLVSMYHFHRDEEVLAWRMIGQIARMCVELGLHRRDALFKAIPDDNDRDSAVNLFWSVYVLDRRWSFGTGMPFALQDSDIDPNLPEPKLDIPYLNSMIQYSHLGSRVWKSVAGFEAPWTTAIKKEDIGYLDYQISQWQKSLPAQLQLPTANAPQTTSRAIHRLQILLYLRANQMRILIYQPVLHSANSIMENMPLAQTVVDLAKDTICALTHLNQTTDIYRVQQVCFNYFLISALAVLFLASCHAPVQFSAHCRDEFYMALDLVKGFSSRSYVSKRLWRTIRSLKEVGPKLGLAQDNDVAVQPAGVAEDPHSSAALAMAGLAGHEISSIGPYMASGQDRGGNGVLATSPMNGFQMSHEMTSLFEAALGNAAGLNGNGAHGYVQDGGVQGEALGVGMMSGANVFGGEEELYRHIRDLF